LCPRAESGNSGQRSVGDFNISNNGTVAQPIGNALATVIGIGNYGFATMTATVNNSVRGVQAGKTYFQRWANEGACPLRAQVIVHELLHLKVPNHGMVFKALSNVYLADHTGKT
jgi:Protein of unknown function DUF45